MRPLSAAFFVAVLGLGCAELLPSTDPGTTGGGKYCNQLPHEEPACYPTEAERAAAWKQLQEARRPPGEAEAEQAQKDAALAAGLAAIAERDRVRAEERQREEDQKQARAAEREREAQERAAKEQAEQARRAEVARMATEKAYAVPAISAIMCSIDDEVADLRQQLDREKRVAALGGATSLGDRHRISSDIVDDTDELKVWGASLKRFGATRLPCKDVAGIAKCRENEQKDCDPAHRDAAAVWAQEFDTLWASNQKHPAR
jgi:hypothetical protein